MRRELLRIARTALDIVIVARDTASMSSPSLNGSRTSLFLNVAANFGGSIEKSPYGSWCSPMMTPVISPVGVQADQHGDGAAVAALERQNLRRPERVAGHGLGGPRRCTP